MIFWYINRNCIIQVWEFEGPYTKSRNPGFSESDACKTKVTKFNIQGRDFASTWRLFQTGQGRHVGTLLWIGKMLGTNQKIVKIEPFSMEKQAKIGKTGKPNCLSCQFTIHLTFYPVPALFFRPLLELKTGCCGVGQCNMSFCSKSWLPTLKSQANMP